MGYLVLFALIATESAGVPLPGETALFAVGVLARNDELSIAIFGVAGVVLFLVVLYGARGWSRRRRSEPLTKPRQEP